MLSSVVARELADCEDRVDAEALDELADLTVVVGRGRAELGHVAEHRHLAPLVSGQMLEGGSHRGWVRVVGVVDQKSPAGQR